MDTVERMRRQASDGRNGMRTQGKEEDKRVTSVAQKVCIQGSGGQWGPWDHVEACVPYPRTWTCSHNNGDHRGREIPWLDLHLGKKWVGLQNGIGERTNGKKGDPLEYTAITLEVDGRRYLGKMWRRGQVQGMLRREPCQDLVPNWGFGGEWRMTGGEWRMTGGMWAWFSIPGPAWLFPVQK